MSTSSSTPELQEIDWLAPQTREVLRYAQQEAARSQSPAVYPEHILLGILVQGTSKVASFLANSGLNEAALRTRISEIFTPSLLSLESSSLRFLRHDLPFSDDVQECIERAIVLITYYLTHKRIFRQVTPEHLVLSIFYHQRMQKLLATFSTTILTFHQRLIEQMEPEAIRNMERLFLFPTPEQDAERKVISFISFDHGRERRILKSVEYPTITFRDILGLSKAKRDFQDIITFFREPEKVQSLPRGILLVGQKEIDQTLFVRALAGEVSVPLTTVFCAVIVERLRVLQEEVKNDQALFLQEARTFIRETFHPIKMFSSCIVFLDGIESIVHFGESQEGMRSENKQMLLQILIELDKLITQQGVVVLAATSYPEHLNRDFIHSHRFERQIPIYKPVKILPQREQQSKESPAAVAKAPSLNCRSCQQPVQAHWKYCIYCRVPLPRNCLKCGTPFPEFAGARFCPECGEALP